MDINIDRELAGQFKLTPAQIGNSLVPATSSSRYILQNYWMDRKTGVAYQVQVQVPQDQIQSIESLKNFPTMLTEKTSHTHFSDVASVNYCNCVGEYYRDNMMRLVSLTANISGMDLGKVGDEVHQALRRAGAPPRSVRVKVAGQVPVLHETFSHLFTGLGLAVCVIFLMLTGYFQSLRMAIMLVLSTLPAIISGVSGVAISHPYNNQRRVLYGSDHVHWRGRVERHPAGCICRKEPGRGQIIGGCRTARSSGKAAPNPDDV